MKEFNLEEYNKLCADFMGMKYASERRFNKDTGWVYSARALDMFHSDWNWIMEVVGKIETLFDGFVLFDIGDETCFVAITSVQNYKNSTTMATKKEAVVHAIWHFLNWYKENKS
jgi:hypothetical protein